MARQAEDRAEYVLEPPSAADGPRTGSHKLAGLGLTEPIAAQGWDSRLPGAVAVGPPASLQQHQTFSCSGTALSAESFRIYPHEND